MQTADSWRKPSRFSISDIFDCIFSIEALIKAISPAFLSEQERLKVYEDAAGDDEVLRKAEEYQTQRSALDSVRELALKYQEAGQKVQEAEAAQERTKKAIEALDNMIGSGSYPIASRSTTACSTAASCSVRSASRASRFALYFSSSLCSSSLDAFASALNVVSLNTDLTTVKARLLSEQERLKVYEDAAGARSSVTSLALSDFTCSSDFLCSNSVSGSPWFLIVAAWISISCFTSSHSALERKPSA